MSPKTKHAKGAKAKKNLTEKDPQPTLTEEQAAAGQEPKLDRNTHGQFTKGNRGGPGNPHARACARMLEVFRNAVSEEDMIRIVTKLVEKAAAGDASAAKIIVAYRIGKPLPASHPDSIDRNEWDHYQKDAMIDKEMKLVMSALPTSVGNDIARISLPIMTAARTHELALQLREGCPVPEAADDAKMDPWDVEEVNARSAAQAEECEHVETSAEQREEMSEPLSNGKTNTKSGNYSTHHTPRATNQNAEGKKIEGKKMKAKKRRAAWLQPLAKQVAGEGR